MTWEEMGPLDEDDDLDPLLQQTAALLQLGRSQDVLTWLTERGGHLLDDADYWAHRAIALGNLRRYEEALTCADRFCELAPDAWWGRWMRGSVLLYLGRAGEAVQEAESAVRLGPFEPKAHLLWAHTTAKLHRRRRKEAVAAVEHALTLAPDDADVHAEAGDFFESVNLDERARRHYEVALAIDPAHDVALHNLGHLDFVEFRFLRAESRIGASAALDPLSPEAESARRVVLEGWFVMVTLGVWAGSLVALILATVALWWPEADELRIVWTLLVTLGITGAAIFLAARSRLGLSLFREMFRERWDAARYVTVALTHVFFTLTVGLTGGWVWAGLGAAVLTPVAGLLIARRRPDIPR